MVKVVSLASSSSLGFLEKVFELYHAKKAFVIKRDNIDLSDYPGIETEDPVQVEERYGWGEFHYHPEKSQDPAQIVFSSGTEGAAKPIVISYQNLADVVLRLNEVMDLTSEIREYVGVPVTYSFGLGRVRAVAAAGGKVYIPKIFDLMEIRKLLDAGEINAISAVPSLWRIVLQNAPLFQKNADKIRWIEIGSQYMSQSEKEALKDLFPKARIVQHYGLTEASRSTFLVVSDTSGEALESVGAATGTLELKINEKGAICIRGENTALGLIQPDQTILSLTEEDGWLETKDRGEIKDGLLWFKGRLDDQINVAGVKVSAEKIERDIAEMIHISSGFCVTSVPDPLRGDVILLALTPTLGSKKELVEKAAEIVVRDQNIDPTSTLKFFDLEELPLTGSGKVQRKKIREAYIASIAQKDQQAPQEPTSPSEPLSPTEQKLADKWRQVMGPVNLSPHDSFYKAGGDSLSAIQITLLMETDGYNGAVIQATVQGKTIREIAQIIEGKQIDFSKGIDLDVVKNWSISAARGFVVLSVLLSHWGPGIFNRLGVGFYAESYLSIIYRMGTICFAIIFGIGIGNAMVETFKTNRKTVGFRLRRAFILVTSGLFLLAATVMSLTYLQNGQVTSLDAGYAFYGVITYYFLALMTVYLWLMGINSIQKHQTLFLICTAVILYMSWHFLSSTFSQEPLNNFMELPRLMVMANYSYLLMTGIAFGGIAIGIWYSRQTDLKELARCLMTYGAMGGAFAVAVSIQFYGLDAFQGRLSPFYTALIGIFFYFCMVAVMIGFCVFVLTHWEQASKLLRYPIQMLIATGALALPIYVFHQLVIPAKDILVELGMGGALSLMISMGVFIVGIGYFWFHTYKTYFMQRK